MNTVSVNIREEDKEFLEKLKIHPRQALWEVVQEVVEYIKEKERAKIIKERLLKKALE